MSTKHETALRVAIAEKRGTLTTHFCPLCYRVVGDTEISEDNRHRHCQTRLHRDSPNYPGDLNACHEMEKVMSVEEDARYWTILHSKTCPEKNSGHVLDLRAVGHATALQRAEAFVKACGLEARVAQFEKEL